MDLSNDQKDLIVFASSIRGGIVSRRSSKRRCGYEIRVELNIKNTSDRNIVAKVLDGLGVKHRKTYTNSDEIDKIMKLIEGLEGLSDTTYGLKMVNRLNGVLKQPETHDEVILALSLIQTHLEVRG